MAEEDQNNAAPPKPEDVNDSGGESLENPSTRDPGNGSSSNLAGDNQAKVTTEDVKGDALGKLKASPLHRLLDRFNIYIFVLVLLIMIAVILIIVGYFGSQGGTNTNKLVTQNLSPATLKELASSDTNVGNSNEVLNVESSAIFSGNILARQTLQVAGNLTVGGTVALTTLAVNGTGQFGQLNVNKTLSVAGDSNVQGNSNVSKNLQVNGTATFGGSLSAPQITTSSLQLNSDLVITHHIDTGGSIPSVASGNAIGSGGTVSISGSDTSGFVAINSGSSPVGGCFATINFTTAFSKTPYVEITPVGSSAGALQYYIDRSNTNFSICADSTPPADASFGFDYFVVD